MADLIYILLTLVAFGIGHAYIAGLGCLKGKAKIDRD